MIRLKDLKGDSPPRHVCKQTAQTSTDGSIALCARSNNFQTALRWLASFSQECDCPIISPFCTPRPFGHREEGARGGVGTRAESALFQPWDPGINPLPRYNPIQLGAAPRLAQTKDTERGPTREPGPAQTRSHASEKRKTKRPLSSLALHPHTSTPSPQ